jgi:aminopeptidase Y
LLAPALALLLTACGGGGNYVPPAEEQAALCRSQSNDTPETLLPCITADGVHAHLEKFAEIALANGGSRASGTPGYEASARYVEGLLREAGYTVTLQRFSVDSFELRKPGVLEQRSPTVAAVPHRVLVYSGSGDVTAAVATPAGALGCTAADFVGFPTGAIALVRRGECTFAQKATNASHAGAAAVVVYNQAAGPVDGDLGVGFRLALPVVGVTRAVGDQFVAQVPGGLELRVEVDAQRNTHESLNVLAETSAGDASRVSMAGAHLDSVPGTMGSNDNGSGSAALLETALQMARAQPRNRVRFAFFGSEELGLVGSDTYVTRLSEAERARIGVYLNFDMIASPNYVYGLFVGNGQASDGSPLGGTAATTIQKVFTDYYDQRGLPWRLIAGADGRSDHSAFSRAGIPHGGLFTGAEEIKSLQDAALWGGTAGVALDACYHKSCDNLANVNLTALAVNAQLVAASVLHFATHALAR